jgi:hypothetical protein
LPDDKGLLEAMTQRDMIGTEGHVVAGELNNFVPKG